MEICIITAVTNTIKNQNNFLGFVVGKTLEEAQEKAKKKWEWWNKDKEIMKIYDNPFTVAHYIQL